MISTNQKSGTSRVTTNQVLTEPVDQLREEYIKMGPFELALLCDRGLFSPEEIKILETYGYWFQAMTYGQVPLVTKRQKQFVRAQEKGVEPKTTYERLWYRYTVATKPPF